MASISSKTLSYNIPVYRLTYTTTPSSVVDPKQIAFEQYLAQRWKGEKDKEGLGEWNKELPVFWEGAGPEGLGRDRDRERDQERFIKHTA
ncbi:hypothetical protein I204_07045 [Kwoniella mangroviensis CBS 8886]|nr:hypothetical protein I204_07045 [Kwoniella mangroviensis CBS 8886]